MRSGSGLLDGEIVRAVKNAAVWLVVARPEFAHRNGVQAFVLQRVRPETMRLVRSARLGVDAAQTAVHRQVAQSTVIISRHQIRERAAIILHETTRLGGAIHGHAQHGGQPR